MAAQNPAHNVAPLRMLALIAAPLALKRDDQLIPITLLPAQQELEALEDVCRRLGVALEIQAEIATADRLGEVFATARLPFDLLHFTGHGSRELDGSSVLALEDETGAVRPLAAADLQRLLGANPCRLAFLSACHSEGLADALLAAGARHVVAINAADAVLDLAARVFARRFYAALLAGRSVADAFEAGRAAVATDDELRAWRDPETLQPSEELKFRLLPDGDPIHRQPLAPAPPRGAAAFLRPPWDRTNLAPVSADPFVGRARELHRIAAALNDDRCRCVAIHGMGGMGKTALALAAGRWQRERDRWRDGVWLVELRNATGAFEARNQIALALDLEPKVAESDRALAAALRDQHALLLLDDLDALLTHDRAGTVDLLRALLGARRLKLITTARRDLPGQVHHQPIELSRLDPPDAAQAFVACAPPVEDWGEWTTADWRDLNRFLDGYPFPIRLAATAMKQGRLPLRELLRRLRENPQGTFRYPGDEEDRETSLAATLDLSYTLLPPTAQTVFTRLALFPAGLTRAAARAILGADSVDALETLAQRSMAEYRALDERFALPEPARRYAEARQPPDALATYAPKALAYVADLIDAADSALVGGQIVAGRIALTLEQPNIERFLDWGYDHAADSGDISRAARATARLGNYWMITGERARPEVLERLRRALAAAQRVGDRLGEANVLQAIGDVQQFQDEREAALASYQQALTLYQAVGAKLGEANVRKAIGDVQQFRKDMAAALASYQQALTLYQAVGDRLGEANVRKAIGDVQQFRKDMAAALASYQQALTLYQAVGAKLGEANVLAALSRLMIEDDPQESRRALEQALALRRAINDVYGEAADLGNYGIALLQRGRAAEAQPYLERARALFAARGLNHLAAQMDGLLALARAQTGEDASSGSGAG